MQGLTPGLEVAAIGGFNLLFSFELCTERPLSCCELEPTITCYFLLNYAAELHKNIGRCKVLFSLLFSFELCLPPLAPRTFLFSLFSACYFLLNYARAPRTVAAAFHRLGCTCYFLLNYAVPGAWGHGRESPNSNLLFSFELCGALELLFCQRVVVHDLLFSFELCEACGKAGRGGTIWGVSLAIFFWIMPQLRRMLLEEEAELRKLLLFSFELCLFLSARRRLPCTPSSLAIFFWIMRQTAIPDSRVLGRQRWSQTCYFLLNYATVLHVQQRWLRRTWTCYFLLNYATNTSLT